MDDDAVRLAKADEHRKDTERRVEDSRSMAEKSRRLLEDIRRRADDGSARHGEGVDEQTLNSPASQ